MLCSRIRYGVPVILPIDMLIIMAEALATLSLVAAIVQPVDFSITIVARLEDFLSKSQEAPKAFRDICVQLPLVTNDLRQTKIQVEARELTLERRNAVLAVIKACHAHLKVGL